ncbi:MULTISPECIES: hypothetical protein [Bradyrhizobium]|uniref:hypothetical protein n=1 Tax=Bradyrhizobium TaxID=374 RepID=UPI0004BCA24A
MNVLRTSIAAMPLLLVLMSRTGEAIAPCLPNSLFAVLLGGEPHHTVVASCVGLLIAAVAPRERLRGGRPGHPAFGFRDISRKRRGGEAPSRPISCSLVQG